MSTSYLLDSSVLIQSLKGEVAIRQRMAEVSTVHISTIALGELYYGAEHSGSPANVRKGLTEVDELAHAAIILAVDTLTARIYGRIEHRQRIKGRMIPSNDLWIAATAIQYNLTLAA